MSLSPAEIRHAELDRGLFGYKRETVDDLLDAVVESFEQVWRERADLTDKVESPRGGDRSFQELESLSGRRSCPRNGRRTSSEPGAQGGGAHRRRRPRARHGGSRATRGAERERLMGETQRIKAVLRGALELVEREGPTARPEAA